MRRVISLSALVSGLLALPAFAAWEAGAREDGSQRTSVVASADGQESVKQLQEMMETGPADVGGMRKLNRQMAEQAKAKLSQMLADTDTPGNGSLEGRVGDFPNTGVPAMPPLPPMAGQLGAATLQNVMLKATFLGVTTSPVTATLREQLGLAKGMGLVVDYVQPDSPAAEAGLKVHDILQKLDDQLLINSPQLAVLVRSQKAGDSVTLTVIRAAKPLELKVKLVEKEMPVAQEGMEMPNMGIPNMMGEPGRGMIFPSPESPEEKGGAGAGAWQKAAGAHLTVNADGTTTTILRDNDNEITLKKDKDGKTSIVAKDKDGKEIYSGPFTTEEDKKKAPPAIAEKVKAQIGEGQGPFTISATGTYSASAIVRSDDVHSIVLTINGKDKTVVVRDVKTGKEIYSGPANTDEDYKNMPAGIAEKVKAMTGKVGGK